MISLKDRQKQIPNGLFFYLAPTKWRSKPGSFESVTTQLRAHLIGNPALAKKLKWSLELEDLRVRVDYFNARVCEANGWKDYYVSDGGTPPPKTQPRNLGPVNAARAVVAGERTLNDWLGAGGVPVAAELANARAAQCAACPKNDKNQPETYSGDWTKYFTKPAADFIRKMLEKRLVMKLSTPSDDKIDVCMGCLCPLVLKVHTPLKHIVERMPDFVKAELAPECWVLKETV